MVEELVGFLNFYLINKKLSPAIEPIVHAKSLESLTGIVGELVNMEGELDEEKYEQMVTTSLESIVGIISSTRDKTVIQQIVGVISNLTDCLASTSIEVDILLTLVFKKLSIVYENSYENTYLLLFLVFTLSAKSNDENCCKVADMVETLLIDKLSTEDQRKITFIALTNLIGAIGNKAVEEVAEGVLIEGFAEKDFITSNADFQKLVLILIAKRSDNERKEKLSKITLLKINEKFESMQGQEKILTMICWKILEKEKTLFDEMIELFVPRLKTFLLKLKETNK